MKQRNPEIFPSHLGNKALENNSVFCCKQDKNSYPSDFTKNQDNSSNNPVIIPNSDELTIEGALYQLPISSPNRKIFAFSPTGETFSYMISKMSPNVSPIHRSDDKYFSAFTHSHDSALNSQRRQQKILRRENKHVQNGPQYSNTELVSFGDDTYMEEDKFIGDKGKKPMNSKYAYKKRSKSEVNSKTEVFDSANVSNKVNDSQTLDSKAFQIHSSRSNAQERHASGADKGNAPLSAKVKFAQSTDISDSYLEKNHS